MIGKLEQDWPVAMLCEVLSVSRSASYAWHQAEPSPRERADQQLGPLVRSIFTEHKRRYGARRIAFELTQRGHSCSPATTKSSAAMPQDLPGHRT